MAVVVLVGSILTGINVCVFQEYRRDETTAEGVMEGRNPHMFSTRTYRRAGKGERLLLLYFCSINEKRGSHSSIAVKWLKIAYHGFINGYVKRSLR